MQKKKMNIGINGLGRIGRHILKLIIKNIPDVNILFINDPKVNSKSLDFLLSYDNINNKLTKKQISLINNISLFSYDKLPSNYIKKIDVLIDASSGKTNFKSIIKYNPKIKIITTYFTNDYSDKIIFGFNENEVILTKNVISGLTCDTVAILPVLKIFLEYNITYVSVFSIHPALSTQQILNNFDFDNQSNINLDLAKYVSFMDTIIPRETSITNIVSQIIPELKDKINSYQLRIPTTDVTAAVITITTTKKLSLKSIYTKIANNKFILLNNKLKTSKNFVGSKYSAIIDLRYFIISKNNVSLLIWYDNEIGYSNRIINILEKVIN